MCDFELHDGIAVKLLHHIITILKC